MPVLEVGTGVGYRRWAPVPPTFWRLEGRGSPGEDEGSNGGSREGAGRLRGDPSEETEVVEAEAVVDVVDVVDTDVVNVDAGAGSAGSAAGFRVESMVRCGTSPGEVNEASRDHSPAPKATIPWCWCSSTG